MTCVPISLSHNTSFVINHTEHDSVHLLEENNTKNECYALYGNEMFGKSSVHLLEKIIQKMNVMHCMVMKCLAKVVYQ